VLNNTTGRTTVVMVLLFTSWLLIEHNQLFSSFIKFFSEHCEWKLPQNILRQKLIYVGLGIFYNKRGTWEFACSRPRLKCKTCRELQLVQDMQNTFHLSFEQHFSLPYIYSLFKTHFWRWNVYIKGIFMGICHR